MIRACLGERCGLLRIACKQPGAGQGRVDPRDLCIEPGDGSFRVCDPPAQRSKRDTPFRCGAPDIRAARARPALLLPVPGIGVVRAALGQHQFLIIIEITVEGDGLSIRHQHETICAGLDQVAVVRHQDHGAGVGIDRRDERRAAIDVEMIGRLIEHDEMRP